RVSEGRNEMSRLYVIESTPSITGANADHRWSLKPSETEAFTRLAATRLGVKTGLSEGSLKFDPNYPIYEALSWTSAWVEAFARDLRDHKGSSIVIAGEEAPPMVHALAHAMNDALGNVDKTVFYTD